MMTTATHNHNTDKPQCANPKVVVFDLDETLGYFTQFGTFCYALDRYHRVHDKCYEHFNTLMDLYPEVLRSNIIRILLYLQKKKRDAACYQIMIYTNNQGPQSWAIHIKDYLEAKVRQHNLAHNQPVLPVFDHIIGAFKINGKIVEPNRTTHEKTMSDFLRCSKLRKDVRVCFLDDIEHDGMNVDNVYYIKLRPYKHHLSYEEYVTRYINSPISGMGAPYSAMKRGLMQELLHIPREPDERIKTDKEIAIDEIASKSILAHLRAFFEEDDGEPNQTRSTVLFTPAPSMHVPPSHATSRKNLSNRRRSHSHHGHHSHGHSSQVATTKDSITPKPKRRAVSL